jgi:hemerythrin-like metal-binding protein
MPIQWDDSFLTGLLTVDHQHQELFRKVNAFHAAMMEGKAREQLAQLLDFLAQYTQHHFRDEEQFMEYYGCPAAEANRKAHQALLQKYAEMRKQFDQDKTGVRTAMEIYRVLSDWLVQHVKGVDLQLRDAIQTQKQVPLATGTS